MGLFDWIFKRPNVMQAYHNDGYFKTLTAYQPHFSTWNGELYESALVRSAIDARARHISKLSVQILGSAQPTLQTKLKLKPNGWQTWSQFLYRASTILDMHNTVCIVPVYDELMNVIGYTPVLPKKCDIVQIDDVPFLRYEFSNGQRGADYLSACAVITKYQYKSDFFGEKNDALDPTMKLEHLNNEAIEESVKNGATYRFSARLNNFSNAEDIKKERLRFNEQNFQDDGGGILLFPNTYADIKHCERDNRINDSEHTGMKRNLINDYKYKKHNQCQKEIDNG
jgi:hypothetical protein